MNWSNNRLTILGNRAQVRRFQKSHWVRSLRARYCELLECAPGRVVIQFDSESPPVEKLRQLSGRWPGIYLLENELESRRIKGLAKLSGGRVDHCELSY